ncbi:MAG: hypothetical protein MUE71_05570, partial [Chitinophagaceae bacterium]|nr:hypothetical protein [Chitinophagaceae bacterium]
MVVFLLMWSLLCTTLYAQQPSYNFRKLGLPEGLHDVTTRCIGQDRMGYIWVGTVGALNRFDGKNVAHFTYVVHDTTSCYNSQPRTIHSDAHGRFWIGYETGLVEFDFDKANFKRIKALEGMYINAIASTTEGILFLATRQGLIKYDSKTNTILPLEKRSKTGSSILNHGMFDLVLRNQKLFIAGSRGVVVYHLKADTAHAVNVSPLNNQAVYSLALDNLDNIWAGSVDRIKLAKLSNDLKQWTVYDHLLTSQITGQPPVVADILIDRSNKVWIATGTDGLMEFHPDVLSVKQFIHHPDIPSSPSGNDYRSLFQDKDHNIWLGCDFWGVNFFDPGKSLFETITPHPDKLHQRQRGVGRGAAQDKNGLLWMGNHDGVSCYNPVTRTYREWTNKEDGKRIIYDNQVRTLLCDRENNIWIGTGSGVNRYNAETGEMEFISPEHLPNSFYNSINMDREGKIWFCTNDSATLYWYDPLTKTYDNICHHPQLKVFCNLTPTSYVLEDSKGRVWISLSRHGIGMWNKRTGEIRQYKIPMDGKPGIPGNQVVDIKEDHNGIIWTSSFNGVCGLDPEKDSFIVFDVNNG